MTKYIVSDAMRIAAVRIFKETGCYDVDYNMNLALRAALDVMEKEEDHIADIGKKDEQKLYYHDPIYETGEVAGCWNCDEIATNKKDCTRIKKSEIETPWIEFNYLEDDHPKGKFLVDIWDDLNAKWYNVEARLVDWQSVVRFRVCALDIMEKETLIQYMLQRSENLNLETTVSLFNMIGEYLEKYYVKTS